MKLNNRLDVKPLRPNSDHSNIKALSVSEVVRIVNIINQVQFYGYFNSFSPLLLLEMYENAKGWFHEKIVLISAILENRKRERYYSKNRC